MKSLLKFLLIFSGTLVALVAIAAVTLVFFVDPNQYRGAITQLVKDSKQRTLTIDGDLKLTVFPRLGIDLGKTTLSERNSDKLFASVQTAQVSVELLPLLKKQLLIDRIRVDGANATLVRHADGTTNIDDLLEKTDDENSPVQFDIAGIALTNSTLGVRDEMTGMVASLNKANITTGRLAEGVPTSIAFDADVRANQPALAAAVTAKTDATFDLKSRQYDLANLDLGIKGNFSDIRNGTLKLSAATLHIDQTNLNVLVDKLKASVAGTRGADNLALQIDIPKLSLNEQSASGETLSGHLQLKGAQTIDMKFNAAGVSGTSKALSIGKLALEFAAQSTSQSLQGTLSTPLKGNLDTQVFTLPSIAGNLTLKNPALPANAGRIALKGNARIDLAKESVAARINGSIDESQLQANVGVTRFASPSIRFDLEVDRINLDRYMPPKAGAQKSGSAKSGASQSTDTPVDLSALKGLNLHGNLRIGALEAQNIKFANLSAALRAAGGRLDVAPFSANLYQGRLDGSASVTASNHLTLKAALNGIAIEPLLKDAIQRDPLEGRGDLALDVTTSGASTGAFKRNLNGSANLILRDGAIKGINLAQSLREFKARIGKADVSKSADENQKTDFSELAASFVIRNGVATNKDLLMKSPLLRVTGSGKIDIGAGKMDYLAKAAVVNTSTGQGGKELEQLKDITIPVRVSGPFDKLGYRIEWASITSEALKSSLKDKLREKLTGKEEEIKSNDASDDKSSATTPSEPVKKKKSPEDKLKEKEDELKDKLKGIFGR